MSSCSTCAATLQDGDRYCSACGVAQTGAAWLWPAIPAATTGAVVALVGVALGAVIPIPGAGGDFFEKILHLVLTTTIPYFHFGFALVGAWAAAVALAERNFKTLGVALLLFLLLFLTPLVAVGRTPLLEIAICAGAAVVGALAGTFAGSFLGAQTKVSRVAGLIPGPRYLGIAVSSWLSVALLVVIYGLAVTAIVIALVVLTLYVVLKITAHLMGWAESEGQKGAAEMETYQAEQKASRLKALFRGAGGKGHFHAKGQHEGAVDEKGIMSDKDGRYGGAVDNRGVVQDAHGNFAGKVGADGALTDASGNYVGKVTDNGTLVDDHGNVVGKKEG